MTKKNKKIHNHKKQAFVIKINTSFVTALMRTNQKTDTQTDTLYSSRTGMSQIVEMAVNCISLGYMDPIQIKSMYSLL